MTTFCIEREKMDNLNQILEDATLDLYKLAEVQALYIIPYVIWRKNDERMLGEEGVNIACYIVLNNQEYQNQELDIIIERLKNLREKTSVNLIGIKADINSYGDNNRNSYSRLTNDNSLYNGEILFDKTGYMYHVKNMAIFSPQMVEYENKVEFAPPLQTEKIRNLIAK